MINLERLLDFNMIIILEYATKISNSTRSKSFTEILWCFRIVVNVTDDVCDTSDEPFFLFFFLILTGVSSFCVASPTSSIC